MTKSARCSRHGNNGDGVIGDIMDTPMLRELPIQRYGQLSVHRLW